MVPTRTTNMHFHGSILDAEDMDELDFALNGEKPLFTAELDRDLCVCVRDARGNDVTDFLPESFKWFYPDNFGTYGIYSVWHKIEDPTGVHHWNHYSAHLGLTEDNWIIDNHEWLIKFCPTESHMRALYRALSPIDHRVIDEEEVLAQEPEPVMS